jgi:hypothetical protein
MLTSALANDQLLNKTNLIRFVIVDNVFSEVRGIIYRGDNSQSGGKNNLSLGNTSIGKGLNGSAGQNDEEEIESGCLCCKRKKKKESKPSIKQPLLDGLKDTKV